MQRVGETEPSSTRTRRSCSTSTTGASRASAPSRRTRPPGTRSSRRNTSRGQPPGHVQSRQVRWAAPETGPMGCPRVIACRAMKKRLDTLLVERGLAESRAQAQALVLAGLVPGHSKPGEQVEDGAEIVLERPPPYVSRGGEKLANALDALALDVTGALALDVGASTGGFADVLLQRGAAHVIALDVGYGQLHPRLRGDARVTVLERTNVRTLDRLPFAPRFVTCDVSFISVRLALPPALRL